VVRKVDISIAKNYLTADEVDSLNRLTVIFLESAELRVKERKDLTLQYWRNTVNSLLLFNEKPILQTAGRFSHAQMEKKVAEIYAEFDARRKRGAALEADAQDLEELQALEQTVKATKK
jgi:hypothetical protein